MSKVVVACVKWGNKYPSSYVTRLRNMVMRNLNVPHEFFCLTDDGANLPDDVHVVPLTENWTGWWNKICLFNPDLFPEGARILYLDLDVVITGSIDFLLDEELSFSACRPFSGKQNVRCNSSILCFPSGPYRYLYDGLKVDGSIVERYPGDQDYISDLVKEIDWFQSDKVVSYKFDLGSTFWGTALPEKIRRRLPRIAPLPAMETVLPKEVSVVVFHGKPDPEDVAKKSYKGYRKAPFVSQHWQ